MATGTYAPIASITLGSSASSVEFSSIPQDYRDLVLVMDCSVGTSSIEITLNADSGSNYSRVGIYGTGSAQGSFSSTYTAMLMGAQTENLNILQFMDYSATDKHKTSLLRSKVASSEVVATAYRYASTSAITSIELSGGGNFTSGSTFALYGIAS